MDHFAGFGSLNEMLAFRNSMNCSLTHDIQVPGEGGGHGETGRAANQD